MKPRHSLFRTYLITFVAATGLLLLVTSAADLYFSYQDSQNALASLQRERAAGAAGLIEQRLSEIVHQIGLSAPSQAGEDAIAWRTHEIRLLRQLPAISDVLLLDREGRELLRLARDGAEATDSKTDYSRNAAFQEAMAGQPYFSPVYHRADNDAYITISMAAGPEQAGITVAEIDLRFLLDGLDRIAAGGHVRVADARGRLITHANPEAGLPDLPQADGATPTDAATYAIVAPLGWRVSIEQSPAEARAPLYTLVTRSVSLLLAGLLLALPAGLMLARRVTKPSSDLQQSDDKLEAPEDRYNWVTAHLRETRAEPGHRDDECLCAQQEAQRQAAPAHERLTQIIEALPLAAYQFRETEDGQYHFTFVAENVRDLLGVSAAEIMADKQARWRTTLPEDRIVADSVLHRAGAAHEPVDFVHRVRFNGTTRWIRSCTSAPRQVDGGWVWNGYWMDQTRERSRAEEMQAATDAARTLARSRSAFLANMSHEIRTPLDSILGYSRLALKTGLTPQQFDYVSKIHQAGTGLFGIINDILDFARIDAGRLTIENTGFTLDHVMENLAAAVGQSAAGKGLALTFDIAPDIPCTLNGDPVRVERILTKLASNAIRFTDRGEVAVRVERIYDTDKTVMLRFLVCDTGIGMTAEQRERLLRAPLHDGGLAALNSVGIGLGLIICKRLAEMMGGGLSIESKPGAGSTVSFTARFALSKEPAQGPMSSAHRPRLRPAATAGSSRPGRISKETFQQLVGYLSSGDRESLACFDAHRDELSSALGRQAVQVEQAIGRFDFDTALSLLDGAMTRLDIGFER